MKWALVSPRSAGRGLKGRGFVCRRRLRHRGFIPAWGRGACAAAAISPLVGEMAGRPEGGNVERCRLRPERPAGQRPLCRLRRHLPHTGGDQQLRRCRHSHGRDRRRGGMVERRRRRGQAPLLRVGERRTQSRLLGFPSDERPVGQRGVLRGGGVVEEGLTALTLPGFSFWSALLQLVEIRGVRCCEKNQCNPSENYATPDSSGGSYSSYKFSQRLRRRRYLSKNSSRSFPSRVISAIEYECPRITSRIRSSAGG